MATGTRLLNDDGSASMATMIMLSHHALRRDLSLFAQAVELIAAGDSSKVEALRDEWKNYHAALHGHHEVEDTRLFPGFKAEHPELANIIDGLSAQHRQIDPLLGRGDRAFDELPSTASARALISELDALLDNHLTTEEAHVIPLLRGAKEFPAPPDEATAELYAGGFAWTMHGVADDVLAEVQKMLPEILTSRLPAARAAYRERCERAWGTAASGASRTSVPEG
jgi:hemerythrin-like domain-containing protein